MTRHGYVNGGCVALLALLAGCSSTSESEATATDLAALAQENTERALRGTHTSSAFVTQSETLAQVLSMGTVEDCAPLSPTCPPGEVCAPVDTPECDPDVTVTDLEESHGELGDAIEDVIATLSDELLTEQNLESSGGSSATYLIGPEFFCDPGDGTPMDPECVDTWERFEPRIRLTLVGEADIDVALLLTSSLRNPVTLELHQDHLQLVVDLGELKATAETIDEPLEGLDELRGQIGFELRKNAERDFSLLFNVIEDVVVVATDDMDQTVSVSVGASEPTAELRFDGNAERVIGSYDLGLLQVTGPLNGFRDFFHETEYDDSGFPLPEEPYTGDIDFVLAGVEGSIELTGETDVLSLSDLGLGDESSSLKYNGDTVARIDLNPDAGRHFDVDLRPAGEGATEFSVSPTFDLTMLLNFAPLASQISDLSTYLLNDTLRIWLEGPDPSLVSEAEHLRVSSGTLHLESASQPEASVVVPEGSCLLESGAEAPAHELFGAFSAGACP